MDNFDINSVFDCPTRTEYSAPRKSGQHQNGTAQSTFPTRSLKYISASHTLTARTAITLPATNAQLQSQTTSAIPARHASDCARRARSQNTQRESFTSSGKRKAAITKAIRFTARQRSKYLLIRFRKARKNIQANTKFNAANIKLHKSEQYTDRSNHPSKRWRIRLKLLPKIANFAAAQLFYACSGDYVRLSAPSGKRPLTLTLNIGHRFSIYRQ